MRKSLVGHTIAWSKYTTSLFAGASSQICTCSQVAGVLTAKYNVTQPVPAATAVSIAALLVTSYNVILALSPAVMNTSQLTNT